MSKRLAFILLLTVLALSACGRAYGPSPSSTPTPTPPEQAEATPPPTDAPQTHPVTAAVLHLSAEFDVATDRIEIISARAVEWPDTSLGCPQPGEAYAEVITPGYAIVLEVEGERFEIHTDETGDQIIICDVTGMEPTPPPTPIDPPEAVQAAAAYVAEEVGAPADDVSVVSYEEIDWPSSALGCPQPGEAYLQVITPGYRVVMSVAGEPIEVHTDATGQNAVICEDEEGEAATVPSDLQIHFQTVLNHLSETYAGFGLEQQPEWIAENVTEEGIVGASEWIWRGGDWAISLSFPIVPEPTYEITLSHKSADLVWSGTLSPEGEISAELPVAVEATVGECDESIPPDELDDWAAVEISALDDGVHIEQNLSYVCCAEIAISAGVDESVIKIIETNTGEVCRCVCGYPISLDVTDIPAGAYTVEVWGVQHLDTHPLILLDGGEVVIP
jgi:hypothetical protein